MRFAVRGNMMVTAPALTAFGLWVHPVVTVAWQVAMSIIDRVPSAKLTT